MKRNFSLMQRSLDYMEFTIASKSGQLKMKTLFFRITFSLILLGGSYPLQLVGQQVRIYNSNNSSLPHNEITAIAVDAQGNKWFGTYYGEVVKFDNENWTVYNSSNSGLPGEYSISSIVIDAQDNKWFGASFTPNLGSGGGLIKFDNKSWTIYNISNSGLPNNTVTGIAIDSLGTKWIGTWGGVAKFDSKWTSYLSSKSISAINIDNYGNKWIATQSEIVKFDDTHWTKYNYSKSIIPYYNGNGGITSIAFDKEGNKWFGVGEDWDSGAAGGATKFDDVNWTFYNSSNSGLPYGVHSTVLDQTGNIWFATSYWSVGALVKYDGTNWTVYDNNNSGLPNDWIESMVIDDQGNKWFTTGTSGVVVFNENGITTAVSTKISGKSDDFTVYPNPARNLITIEGLESGTVEIFNSAGALLKNSEIQEVITKIDISDFPNGIYTIRAVTDAVAVAKKFIKDK